MSALSDYDIKAERSWGATTIEPWNEEQLQPASYDLTLGDEFKWMVPGQGTIDAATRKNISGEQIKYVSYKVDTHVMFPGDFFLATTVETVKLGRNVLARFEGKSSLGRLGLSTHITAGFIDPGFEGTITLELKNDGPNAILLTAGMKIGQIAFEYLNTPAEKVYGECGNRYQNQQGTTVAR